jgi:NADPH:quinone reductase
VTPGRRLRHHDRVTDRAIRIHEHGGPEVLRLEEVEIPDPGPGQVRIRHTAIGVNLRDTYDRTGLYPLSLPATLGVEVAGVVEAVGDGAGFREGDRVAYCGDPLGGYATAGVYPADRLVVVPDEISDEDAAALLLKGLTGWFLFRRVRRVRAGETILFHAAAGGVGLIACQWALHLGVRLIGTAGTPEKAEVARSNGAAEVILYREEDVPARVRELTGGRRVPVVYDSVGRDTWIASLDCLEPFGLMVSYGNASGPVEGVRLLDLATRGSLFATRPRLADYTAAAEDLRAGAEELFGLVRDGAIRAVIGQRFRLDEAAEAHRALESRATTGSTILIP